MDNNACDDCGRPASVHVTEIRDGQKVERHRCAEHAGVAGTKGLAPGQMLANGVPCSTVEEAMTRGMMDNLLATTNFARRHGRMPATVEELREGMSLPDDFVGVEIADSDLRAQLKWVDGLIAFCRAHGRMPQTPDEMPPEPAAG
ncbi:MAG: hypothetical protein JWO31_419 [Phycisphaerales bacterium]|nr:hypothetical protein [Phycisphaerales bacterium]